MFSHESALEPLLARGRTDPSFTMSNPPALLHGRPARILIFLDRAPAPHGLRRSWSCEALRAKQDGGARRDRTDDLMLAKHALYQLSYGPLRSRLAGSLRRPACPPKVSHGRVWWA